MGVMTKLRESTSVVLWVVVFAFGGLWVLQDSGAFDNMGMGMSRDIAVVDGRPVAYTDFNEAFEQQLRAYRQQTDQEPTQAVRDQIAEQLYQELIDDVLREREMDRLGITVSDTEVRELVLGDNPDPLILQLFPDGQGGVDRQRLVTLFNDRETFVQIYGVDPLVLENYLRAKRRSEKLNSLVETSVRVTEGEIREEYLRRNRRATAQYVALRYADVPDAEVEVTDRDLRRYYDANREDFRRERTVTLEFISVPQQPSEADFEAVRNELTGLRTDFANAPSDSAFVTDRFTAVPFSREWVGPDGLDPELSAEVFANPTAGRVVGPVMSGNRASLARIVDTRPAQAEQVRARHILIGQASDPEDARPAQRQRAEELLAQIRAGSLDFAQAASQHSQDPGSAARGGDLGFFGRGRMVTPFEDAAFGASVGEIVGPVETQFGFHLIEVTARADREVQLAILAQDVSLTSLTLRDLRDRMDDVKYYAEQRGGSMQAEAERRNLDVETITVQADQEFIPGLGANRQVRRFVETARSGSTSDVIDTGDAFVYMRATDVQREGYRSFDEVRAELEPRVLLDKKREVQVRRMREAQGSASNLEALSTALGVPVRTANDVQFNNTLIPTLGREPRFVGTVMALSEGQRSGIVEGDNSVFVLAVRSVNEPDPAAMSDAERRNIRQTITNRKRQQIVQQWMEDLRQRADIQDNRAMFL